MSWLPSYCFSSSPPLRDIEEMKEIWRRRTGVTCFAGYEDGSVMACAGVSNLTQNLRGALYPMAGIHNVAVHPAARRKGYARGMLVQILETMRRQGKAVSCLYPFLESFYERFGYVTLPQTRRYTFRAEPLLPLVKKDLGGRVSLMSAADGYASYRALLHTLRPRLHGMAFFDEPDLPAAQRAKLWMALATVDDEPVAAMLYDLKGEQIANYTMNVRRFVYLTVQGKYLLLQWIAHHVHHASTVDLTLPAFEHPETWHDDLRLAATPMPNGPMGRVLDVSRLGGMSVGGGRFAAQVTDALCPWNEGVWQFDSVAGRLHVAAASAANCRLSIQALAALVYGVHDPAEFAVRGWGDPPPPVQDTMRAMFPPQTPYLHETF
jgi:predicted acetyltransferase